MNRLPTSPDALVGLRAARWIRESTTGQFDRYGPEAQIELQDASIRRLGLVDTGLVWTAAHSGRTVYRSSEMASMLDSARNGAFDVLLVGYVSRWQRNLRRTLELLEDTLHPAGVAVWFADEEILSSCDRHWDQLVDEAKDAERYSRRLARRIHEGYASKRAKQRDPGGHPPFGFRRNEDKLIEPDPDKVPTVRRLFELSAAGYPDREAAHEVGLPLFTARGLLTSPLVVGRLRDGSAAHWPALVSEDAWNKAQAVRLGRATNLGRKADPRRPYALPMLHCAACGTRLTGDTGYYRHREPCEAFVAAAPAHSGRGRSWGHAYRQERYEGVVEELLGRVGANAGTLTAVVRKVGDRPAKVSGADAERIAAERERAMARYMRDRDSGALDASMHRLDAQEQAMRERAVPDEVPAEVAVGYLRELNKTWQEAEGGQGRALLAQALFERIDVLGMEEATVTLTEHASRHGFGAVLPEEFGISVSGRGERIRAGDSHVPDRGAELDHRCPGRRSLSADTS
jgi:DNA invertase Pin-like site-specific DNA recombinase